VVVAQDFTPRRERSGANASYTKPVWSTVYVF
jgi:hypothetical protein